MKTQVFISKQNEGWSQLDIPGEFEKLSYDKFVNRIHTFLKRNAYKGLLITQNPEPFEF
jgi:hypothetical protein